MPRLAIWAKLSCPTDEHLLLSFRDHASLRWSVGVRYSLKCQYSVVVKTQHHVVESSHLVLVNAHSHKHEIRKPKVAVLPAEGEGLHASVESAKANKDEDRIEPDPG